MEQIDSIIAYEQGDLNDEATISLFQDLINAGLAYQLQGSYGRTANQLAELMKENEGKRDE